MIPQSHSLRWPAVRKTDNFFTVCPKRNSSHSVTKARKPSWVPHKASCIIDCLAEMSAVDLSGGSRQKSPLTILFSAAFALVILAAQCECDQLSMMIEYNGTKVCLIH